MAAEVFAICIRLKMPSCIRAPPLAEKMTSGRRLAVAYSTARVILSPTAVLMLPIKNRLSSTAATQATPPMRPVAVTAASRRPVLFWAAVKLFLIFRKMQHILRGQICIQLPEAAVVQHQTEPVVPADGHVIAAVGADVKASSSTGCGRRGGRTACTPRTAVRARWLRHPAWPSAGRCAPASGRGAGLGYRS